MYYDVHLLPPSATADPRAALIRHAALCPSSAGADRGDSGDTVDVEVLARVRATWVRPGEGLRIDDQGGVLTVQLPYWYWGRAAREQAKVLHGVVKDLEKATGWRGFDPQLDAWFSARSYKDTVAVLEAVADYQAREHMDTPAVDARRSARATDGKPKPLFRRR